ncbi:PucR C-terminal helix-turn-helix domain-containing protein [Dethiosulfatibacter aminovorans DSM 17477]|uniref:PucR C-terminal helix-turn-helix domain-containing protein n=1 Tax=Dethiosulfatibacter aminovorans DSM 17477 TaxID=1121476 RepID=A0A1M6BM85_9FIRM|nr:PucR family transcriptional regulator [Dethiosulfatibacter aminovorans]SHI49822.1 PucR C-terminal helix-turn-helix domain-containing protein [Dethiosulfatibacter aminovorans DSM 17477]
MKVRDLFSINKEFSKFEVIAGENGLDREITDIDVFEIPDGLLWLNEGEFSITTGYYFKDNPEDLMSVVEYHAKKNASGIGIKLGRFIDSLPQEIIDRANEMNFPIINIPIHVDWGSIIWPVVSSLLGEDSYEDYMMSKFKEELNGIVNKKYYLDEIVLLLNSYLNGDVYIIDKDQFGLIKSMPLEDEYNKLRQIIKSNIDNIGNDTFFEEIDDKWFKVEKIAHHGIDYGYLGIVSDRYRNESNALDNKMLNEVLPHIIIHILSYNKQRYEYFESAEDLFMELIIGNYNEEESRLREEAKLLSLDYHESRVVLYLKCKEYLEETDRKSEAEFLRRMFSLKNKGFYCFDDGEKIVMVLSIEDIDREHIEKICADIIGKMKLNSSCTNMEFGISKECRSLKNIKSAYEEAEFAYKMGNALNNEKIRFYDDYIVYHVMTKLHNHPTVMKLYNNIIVKIRTESGNKEELIKTLKCYVKNDFNISKTSDELYLHRNSLYKRLNKIQEIIGYDFEKSDTKFIINMVSKLDDLIN